jgi:hypothetical protein
MSVHIATGLLIRGWNEACPVKVQASIGFLILKNRHLTAYFL